MNHCCECCHPCCRAVGDILQKSLHHHSSKQKNIYQLLHCSKHWVKKVKRKNTIIKIIHPFKKKFDYNTFSILKCKDKNNF